MLTKFLSLLPSELKSIESFEKKEAKFFEKRKRYQAYNYMQSLFSQVTFFDYFTKDALDILILAKKIALILEENLITEDILLLSFCFSDGEFSSFLKNEEITSEKILENYFLKNPNSIKTQNSFFRIFKDQISKNSLTQLFSSSKPVKENIRFSPKLFFFLNKTMGIALEKYKTPVISSDLLILSFLDSQSGIKLKKLLSSQDDWYRLRFRILKSLYREEDIIKNQLDLKLQQFAYLTKIYLPQKIFGNAIERQKIEETVEVFRYKIVSDLISNVEEDLPKIIEKETYLSIKIASRNLKKIKKGKPTKNY